MRDPALVRETSLATFDVAWGRVAAGLEGLRFSGTKTLDCSNPSHQHLLGTSREAAICQSLFKQKLPGRPLLDLGCGPDVHDMAELAYSCGATMYIGVDLKASSPRAVVIDRPSFQAVIYKGEMAEFLRLLPPQSCNVCINAIDEFVCRREFYDVHTTNWPFLAHVRDGVTAVVPVGGLAFGVQTCCFDALSPRLWINHIEAFQNPEAASQWISCYERRNC